MQPVGLIEHLVSLTFVIKQFTPQPSRTTTQLCSPIARRTHIALNNNSLQTLHLLAPRETEVGNDVPTRVTGPLKYGVLVSPTYAKNGSRMEMLRLLAFLSVLTTVFFFFH